MNKETRKAIYIKALEHFKIHNDGLCNSLREAYYQHKRLDDPLESELFIRYEKLTILFPEFSIVRKQRIKKADAKRLNMISNGGYWWPPTTEYFETRIKAFKKMIKLCK